MLEISSFLTCASKITIIWCMVPEIWSETDKMFSHLEPFFALLPPLTPLMIPNIKILKKMKKMPGDIIFLYIHMYHKWRSYDIWFLKYKVRQTEISDIMGHFLPFQPLDNLENQSLDIEKSTWCYYFTHCTINDNRMMYGSWDVLDNRQFFAILNRFLPF